MEDTVYYSSTRKKKQCIFIAIAIHPSIATEVYCRSIHRLVKYAGSGDSSDEAPVPPPLCGDKSYDGESDRRRADDPGEPAHHAALPKPRPTTTRLRPPRPPPSSPRPSRPRARDPPRLPRVNNKQYALNFWGVRAGKLRRQVITQKKRGGAVGCTEKIKV